MKNFQNVFLFVVLLIIKEAKFEMIESFESKGLWPAGKKLSGPGYGWDYLTAVTGGHPLLNISYTDLRKTNDDKYLVNNCIVVEDAKRTSLIDSSEIIESSNQYTDITSKSMSASFSASANFKIVKVSISGSFSQNFQDMVEEQTKSKTITIRSKYYEHRYTLMLNSDCRLNSGFEQLVREIAFCLKNGDLEWAKYLSQEVVRDYGTHFITKAYIGGIFHMDDYISTSYFFKSDNSYSSMKAGGSLRFSMAFFKGEGNFQMSGSTNTTQTNEYNENVRITKAESVGGSYKPGNTVSDWSKTLDDNLAIIDKEVDLITSLITYFNFPDIERRFLALTRTHLEDAIDLYLQKNLIEGCLDRKSVNYQPLSTYHNPSLCQETYIFGAFFEERSKCMASCSTLIPYTEANYLTAKAKCPNGYTPVVHSFNIPGYEFYNLTECRGEVGFEKSPVLFGGIYTPDDIEVNPVTNSKGCPEGFSKNSILSLHDKDNPKAIVCLSRNYELAMPNAIPFGGFLSTCDTSKIKSLKCEKDYHQKYFIYSINGCFVYYCTRLKSFERMRIKKPPFVEIPPRNYLNEL